mmetsp:Transcript_37499/g.108048  ORF Transcript_37499/g.108048 Transcript_37499/m.108048 type:complete len:327 (+) Transcript_37499:3-983(+)
MKPPSTSRLHLGLSNPLFSRTSLACTHVFGRPGLPGPRRPRPRGRLRRLPGAGGGARLGAALAGLFVEGLLRPHLPGLGRRPAAGALVAGEQAPRPRRGGGGGRRGGRNRGIEGAARGGQACADSGHVPARGQRQPHRRVQLPAAHAREPRRAAAGGEGGPEARTAGGGAAACRGARVAAHCCARSGRGYAGGWEAAAGGPGSRAGVAAEAGGRTAAQGRGRRGAPGGDGAARGGAGARAPPHPPSTRELPGGARGSECPKQGAGSGAQGQRGRPRGPQAEVGEGRIHRPAGHHRTSRRRRPPPRGRRGRAGGVLRQGCARGPCVV